MEKEEIIKALLDNSSYKNKDGSYNKLRSADANIIEEQPISEKPKYDINEILKDATESGASDIHIVVGGPPRYRVTGELKPMPNYDTLNKQDTMDLLTPLLTVETKGIFETDGDLDFAYSVKDLGRFRVNMYKQRGTWAAVFRKLSNNIPSPRDLKLPQSVIKLNELKRGIVLVTGPTGSGKSTTLASLIDLINTSSYRNIITLEDPIEYLHKHKLSNVSQREMGVDTKNFASALRAALREDPDVILVGEMRDFETISTAITAAETGHLVFSTLHTIGATATIDRIIDTYPGEQQAQARAQLAVCFQGIISQQLIPNKEGGRTAAFEIMLANDAIRTLIREGKTEQLASYIQNGRSVGMMLMDDCLLDMVNNNIITGENAIDFAVNKKTMNEKLGHRTY